MYLYIVSPYTKSIRTCVRTYTALRRFSLLSAFIYFCWRNWDYYSWFFLCKLDFFWAIFWKNNRQIFDITKRYDMEVYRRNPCFLRLVFIPSCIHTSSVFIHNLYVHRAALAFPSLWASLRLSCVFAGVLRALLARSLARWVRLPTLWQRRKYKTRSAGNPGSRKCKNKEEMWTLKVAEARGPWMQSVNGFSGRQVWEYSSEEKTDAEDSLADRLAVDKARAEFTKNRYEKRHSADLLMRLQVCMYPCMYVLCVGVCAMGACMCLSVLSFCSVKWVALPLPG